MTTELHDPKELPFREAYLQAVDEMARPYPSIILPWWKTFNQLTGGFRTREFSILCGPTGCGKTAWLATLSAQLLIAGVKHFVMSVETGHTDFVKRVMSTLSGDDLNTGDPVPIERIAKITAEFQRYISDDLLRLSIYDNRVHRSQLCHDLTEMAKRGCRIAMIDNMNFFMEVTRAADAIIEMDRVIHDLIVLCKQIDMHVIMVMHPRKTEGGRVESEFDIKGSSTAVQEAHNVFLFNRPRVTDVQAGERTKGQRELKLAKMRRRGRHAGRSIVYDFTGFARYDENGFIDEEVENAVVRRNQESRRYGN